MRLLNNYTSHGCYRTIIGFAFFLLMLTAGRIKAQNSDISLDLILEPQLTKAQVISLSNLAISQKGSIPLLFNFVIRNNSSQGQNNLYLNIQLRSQRNSVIVEVYQAQSSPFSLDPSQVVVSNNRHLRNNRLPGIEESISLGGGLTGSGEEFANSLKGSTRLPADVYTIIFSIYQGSNGINGGQLVASVEETFGGNLTSDTTLDLYLLQPGGQLGSGQTVNSVLPVFRWEGPVGHEYRLLVVEDNGQSPESLLQAAQSSEPILDNGTAGTGSFLEFEMVDALVTNSTFSMPPSGVQQLEPGKHYYWQVFTNRQTIDGIESVPSEIWEFTVSDESTQFSILSEETQHALQALIGPERYNRLKEEGFDFISLTIDGEKFEGAAGLKKLQEIREKLSNGEASVVIN